MFILINLFYLFCLFPYIKFFPKVDTQPTALILGAIILVIILYKERSIPKELLYFFVVSCITILYISIDDLYSSLRGSMGYWSLSICSYITYKTYNEVNFEKFLKYSINIWLLVGLTEKFFDRYFIKFLISDVRTSTTRGVTGLAPEPTFYGIICIFFMILVIETFQKNKKLYILNLLFQIFYLAQSSMAILFLGIWILLYFFKNISLKNLCILLVTYIIVHIIILYFMEGTRVYDLYSNFQGIKQIFYKDASFNQRASHIYYSLKGAIENYFIPNGFVRWKEYSFIESLRKNYFYGFYPSKNGRIMSGFGGIIFEMGFLGIVLIIKYFYILYKGLKNKEISYFILIIMFSAIQISNPLLGNILGIALVKKLKNYCYKNSK